ncbi:MAG: phospholipase D family protein [Marinifilaceae bacterium]
MKISFLGQGLDFNSNFSVGNKLLMLFKDNRFNKFTVISAFASKAGVLGLSKCISEASEYIKEINIIVGVDQEGTSKEALDSINLLDVNSYIFYQNESPIFHPKIYIFEGDKVKNIIIGSSNLTGRGLFVNVESSLMVEFSCDSIEGNMFFSELQLYYKDLLNFTDPNLFKIEKDIIEKFANDGIVPLESISFNKHQKHTSDRILANEPQLQIPKRSIARIPELFRKGSQEYTNNNILDVVNEELNIDVISIEKRLGKIPFIKDARLFEMYIILKFLNNHKSENSYKINRKEFEDVYLKDIITINNNRTNTWIGLSDLGFINSTNNLTESGLEMSSLEYEFFVVYIYKTHICKYIDLIIDYFCQSDDNLKKSNKDIALDLKAIYLNKDVIYLTESNGRYISSWLNLLRDDFGCIDFKPRTSKRKLLYIPSNLDKIKLISKIRENTKANEYLCNIKWI